MLLNLIEWNSISETLYFLLKESYVLRISVICDVKLDVTCSSGPQEEPNSQKIHKTKRNWELVVTKRSPFVHLCWCMSVSTCVCTFWEETDAGRLILSFPHWVTRSVMSSAVLAIFLYSLRISCSEQTCFRVLKSGRSVDRIIRWGNMGPYCAALMCIFWHFCVVLSCLATIHVVNFLSLHPGIWSPDGGLCGGRCVGRWIEAECMKWVHEGSKLLTG